MRAFAIRRAIGGLACLCAAASLAGCDSPADSYSPVTGPTFVSLNPCLDAILVEVAEPDQILALSYYSRDPQASSIPLEIAREHAFTGGTAEEIFALEPDIVLASSFIAPATRAALERGGLQVETFGSPTSVDASIEQVTELAELAGNVNRANNLLGEIRSGFRPTSESRPSVLLWQPGEIVPGDQTLIAALLAEAGFASHAQTLGLAQADRISLEQVIANPPDLLLIAGDSSGQAHPALQSLDGTRAARLDPRLLYCAGPTIPQARARIAELRRSFSDVSK